jgi:ribosomal protein L12E/L44/L45/RPP1/RPP2
MLTKRGADILVQLEHMMDDAHRAMAAVAAPTASATKRKEAAATPKGDALAAALEGRAFERN